MNFNKTYSITKKFLLPIIVGFLIISAVILVGCSSQGTQDNNDNRIYLPYDIDNKGCIKRFYATETNSINVTIPATYSIDENGKIIAGKAYEIKTIGEYCFANNNLIESVFIPNTITTINEYAFYNCSKLTTVNVTKNIETIGNNAFELCPQLKVITRNGNNGLIIAANENLKSFMIPSSIIKVGNNAFANWLNLTSITIEDNINYIGNEAFLNCHKLARITINAALEYLGDNAFSNCELLTSLNTSGGGICFTQKQLLSNFTVPSSVVSIQNEFFYGWEELKTVNIHESITSLGMIFKDNQKLTKLTCGSNNILSLFYHHADYNPTLEIENMYTCSHKPSSTSYTYIYYIPDTLAEIHLLNDVSSYCLYGMKSIQKVYLASKVTEFGTGAFAGCSGLTNVYFITDNDWEYNMSVYNTVDRGTVSKADMNNSTQLATQLKAHNGSNYRWYKS